MKPKTTTPAFVLMALASFHGVWFHFDVEPAVTRGAKAVSGEMDLPAGFYMALHLGSAFWTLPVALLVLWFLSRRFAALRTQVAFAIYGALMAVTYLTYGLLLLTPLLSRGVSL